MQWHKQLQIGNKTAWWWWRSEKGYSQRENIGKTECNNCLCYCEYTASGENELQ